MLISKKIVIITGIAVLAIGMLVGFFITKSSSDKALAVSGSSMVDRDTLEQLFQAAFGRPVDDDGAKFHLGRDLKQVLHDINNSEERRYYSALFKSVKAYEEAVRAPGDLNTEDKQKYLDNIDSALSTLLAWVETLPQQSICRGIVGIVEARQAIQDAYDKMSPTAKAAAEKGIFKALKNLGRPKDLPLPLLRCLTTPSPTVSVSVSPSVSPSSTPTVSPTSSPSPTISATSSQQEIKTFTVNGNSFSFDPKEIRVKKGDKVKIIFKNEGGTHDWVIDEFNAKTPRIETGQTTEVEFIASRTGTFEYYCSVGSHRAMGMKGNLIVE